MGRSAEAWQQMEEATEQQRDAEMEAMYAEYQAEKRSKEFADSIWNLGCKLNADRLAEIERDMEPHKRTGYVERLYEIADMQRKAKRENHCE